MSLDSADPNSVIQQQVLGQKTSGITLKSIFSDASYLKTILIFSVIINVLLICGVIALFNRGGSTVTPTVTPTPSRTPTPTPTASETPDQTLTRLQKCFKDCNNKDFLENLKIELQKVRYFKSTGDYADYTNKNCYGYFTEAISPDKEFVSYFAPKDCDPTHGFNPPPTKFKIGSNTFLLTSSLKGYKWETASITPSGQSRVVDIVDLIMQQQTIKTEFEQRGDDQVRILTAESEKVNEFNQLVKTTVQIKANINYQLVYFRDFEEKGFNENGRFWDYDVPNQIEAPINL